MFDAKISLYDLCIAHLRFLSQIVFDGGCINSEYEPYPFWVLCCGNNIYLRTKRKKENEFGCHLHLKLPFLIRIILALNSDIPH